MNHDYIVKHWYAGAYEQFETQTDDVEFIRKVLREQTDGAPQTILEAACGGGRICVPLARAGHTLTGFDADAYMLLRCARAMQGVPNIVCYQADALSADWGSGFDVVLLAGNILINIETDGDYAQAQQTFIRKAAAALRSGGHLLLDYDQHSDASAARFFNHLGESGRLGVACEYADDLGTTGSFKNYGSVYDPVTRLCTWASHLELRTNNGRTILTSTAGHKHIPALAQVYQWLAGAGLTPDATYRNYTNEPLCDHEADFVRATIWARKP